MPVILCRHGATAKNIDGGTDDRWTPLHDEGWIQATETGARLLSFCHQNRIARVQPVTSGYDRTNASCTAAMSAFAAEMDIEILPRLEDARIGEIKFRPRNIVPTPENPGLFGRMIEGASLADVTARLTAFDTDLLNDVAPDTAFIAFGHRTTHRLLAMIHLAQSVAWMETLPRMDNCELWLLRDGRVDVLHSGYPAARDEPDPRRTTFK